jgi:hypothetical protein
MNADPNPVRNYQMDSKWRLGSCKTGTMVGTVTRTRKKYSDPDSVGKLNANPHLSPEELTRRYLAMPWMT